MAWEEKKYNCADNYQQIMSIDIEMFLKHKILYKIEFSFYFLFDSCLFQFKDCHKYQYNKKLCLSVPRVFTYIFTSFFVALVAAMAEIVAVAMIVAVDMTLAVAMTVAVDMTVAVAMTVALAMTVAVAMTVALAITGCDIWAWLWPWAWLWQ